jgi:hypothetical protein
VAARGAGAAAGNAGDWVSEPGAPERSAYMVAAFRKGLSEMDFVEAQSWA